MKKKLHKGKQNTLIPKKWQAFLSNEETNPRKAIKKCEFCNTIDLETDTVSSVIENKYGKYRLSFVDITEKHIKKKTK